MAPVRILYIDDDEGIRRLVARALARKGYEVSLAASGSEGLALVACDNFDLVAVDHYMPGMDGLQTLEALRALPACPPVVYVTGSEESRIAVAARPPTTSTRQSKPVPGAAPLGGGTKRCR